MAARPIHPKEEKAAISINYSATPTARLFHNSKAFVKGMLGPVGSSKTVSMCMEMFSLAMRQPPDDQGIRKCRSLVVRSTFPELKTTTVKSFLEWFGAIGTITYGSPIEYRCNLPLGDGTVLHWEVWFKSVDGSQDSLDSMRSLEITHAYLNEAHEIAAEVYAVLKGRVGRFRPYKPKDPFYPCIILDSNYGSYDSPLKKMVDANLPSHEFFQQPPAALWDSALNGWVVNPMAENLEHLSGGLAYYERQIAGTPDYMIRQLLACLWASPRSGKPVFPEYSPRQHLFNGNMIGDKSLPLLCGIDFGLHVACVLGQMSPQGGLRILAEVWDDDASLEEFIPAKLVPLLNKHFRGFNMLVCGDPAGMGRSSLDKRTAFTILKTAGFFAFPSPTNDPVTRRDAVRGFLTRTNGFMMNPECKRLEAALGGAFGYKRRPDGTYSDVAEKNNESHVAEALEYLAVAARMPVSKHRKVPDGTVQDRGVTYFYG